MKQTWIVRLVICFLSSWFLSGTMAAESSLGIISEQVRNNPSDFIAGIQLRKQCVHEEQVDYCIDFFNGLVKQHPDDKFVRYNAALAYVDKIPGHSLIKQGWYSNRSIDHVTVVIEKEPDDWVSYYIRGLNNVYWPAWFRRLDKAEKDLKKCIEISSKLDKLDLKPYHLLAYIALGDAYAKGGNHEDAVKMYLLGAALFPSKKIDQRLSMEAEKLHKYIVDLRDTNKRVDTDISFLKTGGSSQL